MPEILVEMFSSTLPVNCVVFFLEKIPIPVQPYLEWLSGKALESNCRNSSSSQDGGKSLIIFFLVFVVFKALLY